MRYLSVQPQTAWPQSCLSPRLLDRLINPEKDKLQPFTKWGRELAQIPAWATTLLSSAISRNSVFSRFAPVLMTWASSAATQMQIDIPLIRAKHDSSVSRDCERPILESAIETSSDRAVSVRMLCF